MRFLSDILIEAGLIVDGSVQINAIPGAITDTDKFLVSDGGVVKYRSGSQIASDIDAMTKAVYDTDGDGIVDDAEKITVIARNSTGSTIYKGTIVYLSGSTGNRPNMLKAQANSEATSSKTFGVVVVDVANNSDGEVAALGTLHDLDTRSNATHPFTSDTLVDGDVLWLSPTTAGYVTRTKPTAPNHAVFIGIVARTSPTNGRIVYRVQNGFELEELHNVSALTPANNDGIFYNSSTGLWEAKSIATAAGGTIGTVTSVAMTVPTGLQIGGSPITTSGTLALTYASGYAIPTTVKQSNWDDAYTWVSSFPTQTGNTGKFLKTDGSSLSWAVVDALPSQTGNSGKYLTTDGTTASWATINLSGYVVNTRTLTINGTAYDLSADRSWSVGTVTSVAATAGTGISISGSPITGSGTFTITNTAPDQTVSLTAGTGISVSGTYPNFTITNTSTSSGGTVTSVAALTLGTTGTDLSSTVANPTTTPVITLNVPTASATNRGALSSADWSTFNAKQNAITLTTTGSSGSATLVGATLNIPTYTLAGLGGVSGSGTTNYLSKWTSSSALGNSLVFDDGTNIGFNTASPSTYLAGLSGTALFKSGSSVGHSVATSSTNYVVTYLTASNQYIWYPLPSGTRAGTLFTNSGNWVLGTSSTDNGYRLDVSGTLRSTADAYFATSSGNVGIGTTSTAYKLDVNGAGNFSGGVNVTGSGTLVNEFRSNGIIAIDMTPNLTDDYKFRTLVAVSGDVTQTAINNISINSGGFFGFGGGGSEKMRLTSAGRLLIGTTTESTYELDVVGDIRSTLDANINGLTVGKGGGSVANNTALGSIALNSNTSGDYNTAVGRESLTLNTTGAGNIGLGWASGRFQTTGNYNLYLGYGAGYYDRGSNNIFVGFQTGYHSTYSTSSNNLGVGHQALNVVDADYNIGVGFRAGNGITTGTYNTIIGSGTAANGITTGSYNTIIGSQITGLSASLSNTIILADGQGNQRLYIDNTGNVGIGTTSPSALLHVNSTSAQSGIRITAATFPELYFYKGATATGLVAISGNAGGYYTGTLANALVLQGNGGVQFVDGGGNLTMSVSSNSLLIGTTTSSGYKLDVNGTARVSGNTLVSNTMSVNGFGVKITPSDGSQYYAAGPYDALFVDGSSTSAYGFYTGMNFSLFKVKPHTYANPTFIIKPLGNTYLEHNLSAAPSMLELYANTSAVYYGSGDATILQIGGTGFGNFGLYTGYKLRLVKVTGISEGLTIMSDGSSGFGTISPNSSAKVEISSTTQGFLPPRMTAAQKNAITSPATGLIIYQTDGTAGLYVYNGTAWKSLAIVS